MTTPSTLNVVVERTEEVAILRSLLNKEFIEKLSFYAGNGLASPATIGRNLLVHEGDPVLIIMNADTFNPHRAEEQKAMVSVALGRFAPDGYFKVFAFVPEVEVIFFEAPEALQQLLGGQVSKEVLHEGLWAPKQTLMKLLAENKFIHNLDSFLAAIDQTLAQKILAGKQARALVEIIETMLKPAYSAAKI